jgi:hypothetical protein
VNHMAWPDNLIYLVAFFISAWLVTPDARGSPCQEGTPQCAMKARSQSPIRKIGFWKVALEKPLERRIGPAPAELATYLALDNIVQGIPIAPQSMSVSDDVLDDVKAALAELPPTVRQMLSDNLVGIHFVRGLGGTAFTDYVAGDSTHEAAAFVVLDMEVLGSHLANSWATWKENSPFMAHPRFRLEVELERQDGNTRKNAIQYILLHELGHVLSIGRTLHPPWQLPVSADRPPRDYAFSKLSWKLNEAGTGYTSMFEAEFSRRKDVVFYFGARLGADQMASAYEQLEHTNFVTLYGATAPVDDFADAFASYVHTVLMGRPLEIRILQDEQLVKTYRSCWAETRCAEKRKVIEQLLQPRPKS